MHLSKKRILIISYTYPPANVPAAQRPYSIAKYLDKDKFDVTVLTCGNQDSSLGFDPDFNEELENVNLIKVDAFKVSKDRTIATNNKKKQRTSVKTKFKQVLISLLSYFVFPDKAIFWYPKVAKFVKTNKDNFEFDVIFSTSPMFTNHLVAKVVKKYNPKAKLISDFRDFHYLEAQQKKKGIKKYFHKKLEYDVIKNSDKVCFISEAMKAEYANYYTNFKSKFHAIYNGFDFEEYQIDEPQVLNNEKLRIFYAGSFYKGVRDPLPLLNILEELIKQNKITENDIQIEIAGNFENELVDDIKHLKIFKAIRFLGLLPRNEVLKKYRNSHLLWLIVGNKVSHYTGVPVKFYEYLASQRPVINFAPSNSESTRIIKDLNVGWNFDTDIINLAEHIARFNEIIERFKTGELNKNLDLVKIEKYSRKNQTGELEKILEEL